MSSRQEYIRAVTGSEDFSWRIMAEKLMQTAIDACRYRGEQDYRCVFLRTLDGRESDLEGCTPR